MKKLLLLAPLAILVAAPSYAAEPTQASAKKLIENYYKNINAKNYTSAFKAWEITNGKNGANQTLAQFKKGFAKTKSVKLTVDGVDDIDAGVGNLYTTVHIHISAQDNNNKISNYSGDYVLHTNQVELPIKDWKIREAKLKAQ